MIKKHFISVLLSFCIITGTTAPVFANVNDSTVMEDKIIFDLTDKQSGDNYFALRNNATSGFFDSRQSEQAWKTENAESFGGKGVAVAWDKMDDYGLWNHAGYPGDPDSNSRSPLNAKYKGVPSDGAYIWDANALSDGLWTDAAKVMSPRRNRILLAIAKHTDFDINNYSSINLSLYSAKKTEERIRLTLLGPNTSSQNVEKFYYDFYLDWENSWKIIEIPTTNLIAKSGYSLSDKNTNKVTNFYLENRGLPPTNSYNARVDNEARVLISKMVMTNSPSTLSIIDLTSYTNASNGAGEFAFAANYHSSGFYNTRTAEQAWEISNTKKYNNKGFSLVWDHMNDYGLYNHTGPSGKNDSSEVAFSDAQEPSHGSYVNTMEAVSDGMWIPVKNSSTQKYARVVRTARRNTVHLSPHRYNDVYYSQNKDKGKGKDFDLENYEFINLIMYSEKRTDENIRLSLIDTKKVGDSFNETVKFTYTFKINWEDCWKIISIPVSKLTPTGASYNTSNNDTNSVTRFSLENRGTLDIDFPKVDNENKLYLSKVYMSKNIGDGINVYEDDKIDVSLSSDEYTISGDKIHGYGDMTVKDIKAATRKGEKVIIKVCNQDGTTADDNAICKEGMYIESRTESGSQIKKYYLGVSSLEIHDIEYKVNDTILDGHFIKGTVKASVNIDAYKPADASLVVAYYKDNTLSSISINEKTGILGVGQKLETTLEGIDETVDATVKIMLLDTMSGIKPLKNSIELTPLQSGDMSLITKTYPGFVQKAVTLSYDDGADSDVTFINDYLNKYGLKATFNIQTNWFDNKNENQINEYISRYDGHEIANHTNSHPEWGSVSTEGTVGSAEETRAEMKIAQDKILLYSKTVPKGGAWSFDGPCSLTYYEDALKGLEELGIKYIRRSGGSGRYELPENWLKLKSTCHHDAMASYSKDYIDLVPPRSLDTREALKMFYVWGHSWEFVPGNKGKVKWNDLEGLLKPFADKTKYWQATNIDLCEYVQAMDKAEIDTVNCTIFNPTNIDLYFEGAGQKIIVKAGESAKIFEN